MRFILRVEYTFCNLKGFMVVTIVHILKAKFIQAGSEAIVLTYCNFAMLIQTLSIKDHTAGSQFQKAAKWIP